MLRPLMRGLKRKELPTHEEYLRERYFRPLDGVRAISILLVLTWHVNSSLWAWLSGWEGPSIFFVISGFLITTLCLREESRDGSVSLTAFYIRRACRILPRPSPSTAPSLLPQRPRRSRRPSSFTMRKTTSGSTAAGPSTRPL